MAANHKPKVVVITGASAGVGRATAKAFARMGIELWETTHRGWLAAAGAGTAGALGWKLLKSKRTDFPKSPSERKTGTYD